MAITLQGSSPTLQAAPLTVQGSSPTLQSNTSIPIQGTGTNPGIRLTPAVPAVRPSTPPPVDPYAALQAEIDRANQPVYAPRLDIAAVNAQARKAAAGAVNPFYTKTLNDFLTQQAQEKAFQEQQNATNVKNLQDQLTQTTAANAVTGQRAGENAATSTANTNTAADQYQTDQGTATDQARIDLARKQAEAGLSGGVAAGQQLEGTTAANTAEARQGEQFQQQRDQANLLKNRTLEDITTSNANATTAEQKGEAQAKFDLDKYIAGNITATKNERNTLEQQRLQAIQSETQNQAKLAFSKYLAGISNPAQYVAALNTYGGAF